jgi:phage tail-like protein
VAGATNQTNTSRPRFSFSVDIAGVGTNLSFQEVSGLDLDTQATGPRGGKTKNISTIDLPGIHTSGTVILKRGVVARDNAFFAWANAVERNMSKRSSVTIRLLDEKGRPTRTWTLHNAWPTKYDGPDLNATGTDVAIETLELAHEGISLET